MERLLDRPAETKAATRRLSRPAGTLLPLLFFFVLPLVLFWPVLWGDATLVPFDNLYQGLPWSAYREQVGAGDPHNALVSDLVLQNVQWKHFAADQYRQGELPLWQNRQLAGSPFLAAGQHSMLYPLSLLFLLMPVEIAFGWFTVLSLALAGMMMYLFARVLGLNRPASLLAGLVYQGSGFLTISVVFPMIIAGATWLPLLLASIHRLGEKAWREGRREATTYIPWMGVGAVAIGLVALAGHPEILYYTLLVGGFYALWQLGLIIYHVRKDHQHPGIAARFVAWGAVMLVVGMLLGAAQILPLYEMVSENFRDSRSSPEEVLGYAWPARQASSFVVPDLLGNPARHQFYNLASRRWEPIVTQEPVNEAGDTRALDHVAWFKGTGNWKNYVEGGGYLGILPLLLAAVALWRTVRPTGPGRRFVPPVAFFSLLALLSLLFIFGSRLYAVLFYTLPGWNQLNTPFRWIFPLTLAVAALAGTGLHLILQRPAEPGGGRGATRLLGWPAVVAGTGGVLLLAIIWLSPGPFIAQAAKLLDRSQLTQWAFGGSAELFVSYQWVNFLHLGLALAGAGGLLLWATTRRQPPGGTRLAGALALAVVLLDLAAAAWGVMPRTPMALADFTPPSVAWLAERHEPGAWRYTALERDRKVLNANSTMRYGLEDIRGYDSIILKHYAHYMKALAPQHHLVFNRIAPLTVHNEPVRPLLDLLNVRYVVTDQAIDWPGWSLVHDEAVRIYENERVLPRAFLLGNGTFYGPKETLIPIDRLRLLDPRQELYLQGDIAGDLPQSDLPFTPAEITEYRPNEIVMEIAPPEGAWLVLSDVDFNGWRAFTRPAGAESERELEVLRANGAFRAVWVEPGEQTIRWKYSPNSVKAGFFASFLGVAALLFAAAFWFWGQVYRDQVETNTAQRVAKNSVAPMVLQLLNKGIDTVFAAFVARLLGPESLGQYAFAVAIIWYFIIFSNFGLGTLLTRDAARDRESAARLLNTTLILRAMLYAIIVPLLLLLFWVWPDNGRLVDPLERETILAITLLAVGLIPSNISDAVTAVFRAYERFEIPALVTTIATFVKVSAGAALLLAGYGIVGLAATSILTNLVTLIILAILMVRLLVRPTLQWERIAGWSMLKDALPLMINEFLATAFFRIDQVMLKPLRRETGNEETGYYNVAYKFIDGLLILPSTFTLAIFPIMSRYAEGKRDALLRTTVLSLRWLVMIALPLALLTTRYAGGIVLLFGGREYLPFSAIALQILIWFLPFSFINSLLQYVLIAAGRQHSLTRAYLVALCFNLVANFFAIRTYGLYGAAGVTIFSEIALLLPFYRLMRESVGLIPWPLLFTRPLLALALAAAPLWAIPLPFWIAIPASLLVYLAALLLLGTFRKEDRQILGKLLPERLGARIAPVP